MKQARQQENAYGAIESGEYERANQSMDQIDKNSLLNRSIDTQSKHSSMMKKRVKPLAGRRGSIESDNHHD